MARFINPWNGFAFKLIFSARASGEVLTGCPNTILTLAGVGGIVDIVSNFVLQVEEMKASI